MLAYWVALPQLMSGRSTPRRLEKAIFNGGHIVEFTEPFSVGYSDNGYGMGIDFGDQLRINLD